MVRVVDSHAFDFPRRHILPNQRVAAVLANGHAVQPAGLFDLGLPLELFRHRRRACRTERGRHAFVSRAVHGDRFLVFQNRLSAEELARLIRFEYDLDSSHRGRGKIATREPLHATTNAL